MKNTMENTKTIWRPNQKNFEYTTEEIAEQILEYSEKSFNWIRGSVRRDKKSGGINRFDNGLGDHFGLTGGIYLIRKTDQIVAPILLWVGESLKNLSGRSHRFWRTWLDKCTPRDGKHGAAEGLLTYADKVGPLTFADKDERGFERCTNLQWMFFTDIDYSKIKRTSYETDVYGASDSFEENSKKILVKIENILINTMFPYMNRKGVKNPNMLPEVRLGTTTNLMDFLEK